MAQPTSKQFQDIISQFDGGIQEVIKNHFTSLLADKIDKSILNSPHNLPSQALAKKLGFALKTSPVVPADKAYAVGKHSVRESERNL